MLPLAGISHRNGMKRYIWMYKISAQIYQLTLSWQDYNREVLPFAKELAKWQPFSLSMPFQLDECNHHGTSHVHSITSECSF